MDVTGIADIIIKNKIAVITAIFILFLLFAPVIPVKIPRTITVTVPVEIPMLKIVKVPHNETGYVKTYHTDVLEPPVEKEEIVLLYHVKGDCTSRIPDYRQSSTNMEVFNLDSVPGNFTFFIGFEVKRNSDVENYDVEGIETPTKEPIEVWGPCEEEDCEDFEEKDTLPVETDKPTNIVLGEEQTEYIKPGESAVFSYSKDIDIRQCIFREVTLPKKTIYKELGIRNETGQIDYWYEPVNETVFESETVVVNETEYREIETTELVPDRWTVWEYLTRPKQTEPSPSIDYELPHGEG